MKHKLIRHKTDAWIIKSYAGYAKIRFRQNINKEINIANYKTIFDKEVK